MFHQCPEKSTLFRLAGSVLSTCNFKHLGGRNWKQFSKGTLLILISKCPLTLPGTRTRRRTVCTDLRFSWRFPSFTCAQLFAVSSCFCFFFFLFHVQWTDFSNTMIRTTARKTLIWSQSFILSAVLPLSPLWEQNLEEETDNKWLMLYNCKQPLGVGLRSRGLALQGHQGRLPRGGNIHEALKDEQEFV